MCPSLSLCLSGIVLWYLPQKALLYPQPHNCFMKMKVFGVSVQEAVGYEPCTTSLPSLCSVVAGWNGVEAEWGTGKQEKCRSSLRLISTSWSMQLQPLSLLSAPQTASTMSQCRPLTASCSYQANQVDKPRGTEGRSFRMSCVYYLDIAKPGANCFLKK